ncbi:NifU-like protein, putative [Plasmodium reichenowi]|uniref:NifU-like protein, putative n=1 Tax=Plasmodium reichenowi TaxID=5854 RepID=A0A060RSE2_PLARE|nr:NifU-like protein, putative [Plasmodium reichenowi]KYN98604.1 NifU-like protein, putative [Plasmodium reichenowi]CDO64368.1 NifU-like protein, putative [Plasmodium reichenowi]
MIHFKNAFSYRHSLCMMRTFHINIYKNVKFSNYITKALNKYIVTKKSTNPRFFSIINNSDYINYINEINKFIDIFEKNVDNKSINEEHIIPVLEKIKNEKIYKDNEDIMEIISSIKLLIEKRVRPIILNDGGDIKFICFDVDKGIVYVQLEGACVTCAQSEVTLQYMIKNMLTYYISEIKEIKNVSKDGIIL